MLSLTVKRDSETLAGTAPHCMENISLEGLCLKVKLYFVCGSSLREGGREWSGGYHALSNTTMQNRAL